MPRTYDHGRRPLPSASCAATQSRPLDHTCRPQDRGRSRHQVGVAAEVGQVVAVTGLCVAQLPVEEREVLRAVHQGGVPVALAPGAGPKGEPSACSSLDVGFWELVGVANGVDGHSPAVVHGDGDETTTRPARLTIRPGPPFTPDGRRHMTGLSSSDPGCRRRTWPAFVGVDPGQLGVLAFALIQPSRLRPPCQWEYQHLVAGHQRGRCRSRGPPGLAVPPGARDAIEHSVRRSVRPIGAAWRRARGGVLRGCVASAWLGGVPSGVGGGRAASRTTHATDLGHMLHAGP